MRTFLSNGLDVVGNIFPGALVLLAVIPWLNLNELDQFLLGDRPTEATSIALFLALSYVVGRAIGSHAAKLSDLLFLTCQYRKARTLRAKRAEHTATLKAYLINELVIGRNNDMLDYFEDRFSISSLDQNGIGGWPV
jgi:hypothetical protein